MLFSISFYKHEYLYVVHLRVENAILNMSIVLNIMALKIQRKASEGPGKKGMVGGV